MNSFKILNAIYFEFTKNRNIDYTELMIFLKWSGCSIEGLGFLVSFSKSKPRFYQRYEILNITIEHNKVENDSKPYQIPLDGMKCKTDRVAVVQDDSLCFNSDFLNKLKEAGCYDERKQEYRLFVPVMNEGGTMDVIQVKE